MVEASAWSKSLWSWARRPRRDTRSYYDVALAVKAETEAGDIASAIDRLNLLGTLEPEDTNITAALATMKKMAPKPTTGR